MIVQYLKNLIKPIAPIRMSLGPLALAGIAAVPGVIKGIQGARQMAMDIKPDPISPETKEATAMARQRALATQMPGEAQMKENLAQSTAQSIANVQKSATGTADILAGVSGATTAQNKALRDLGIQSAVFKDRAGVQLQQQLGQQAQERQFNRQQAQAIQEQYRAAGMQNIFSGLSDLTNIGLATGMGMFGDVKGGGGNGGTGFSPNVNPMGANVMGTNMAGIAAPRRNLQADFQRNFGKGLTGIIG